MNKRMSSLQSQEEVEEMKAYLHQIFLRPASGEFALNTILSVGSWARKPLVKRLPNLKIEVSFFYGDIDWMDSTSAKILLNKKLV